MCLVSYTGGTAAVLLTGERLLQPIGHIAEYKWSLAIGAPAAADPVFARGWTMASAWSANL